MVNFKRLCDVSEKLNGVDIGGWLVLYVERSVTIPYGSGTG